MVTKNDWIEATNELISRYEDPEDEYYLTSYGNPDRCPFCILDDSECENCIYTLLIKQGIFKVRRSRVFCSCTLIGPKIPDQDSDLETIEARKEFLENIILPAIKSLSIFTFEKGEGNENA